MRVRNEAGNKDEEFAGAVRQAIINASPNPNNNPDADANADQYFFWRQNRIPNLADVRGRIVVLHDYEPGNPGIWYRDRNRMTTADGFTKDHDQKLAEIEINLQKPVDQNRIKLTYSSSVGPADTIPQCPCEFDVRQR